MLPTAHDVFKSTRTCSWANPSSNMMSEHQLWFHEKIRTKYRTGVLWRSSELERILLGLATNIKHGLNVDPVTQPSCHVTQTSIFSRVWAHIMEEHVCFSSSATVGMDTNGCLVCRRGGEDNFVLSRKRQGQGSTSLNSSCAYQGRKDHNFGKMINRLGLMLCLIWFII